MENFKNKNIRVEVTQSVYGGLLYEQDRRRKREGKKTSLANLMLEYTYNGLKEALHGENWNTEPETKKKPKGSFLDGPLHSDQKQKDHSGPSENDSPGSPWVIIEEEGYAQQFRDKESIVAYYELKQFEREIRVSFEQRNDPLALKRNYENSQKGRFLRMMEHEKVSYYSFAYNLGYMYSHPTELKDVCDEFDEIMNDGNPDLPVNIIITLVEVFGDHYGADWIRFGVGEPDWENLSPLRAWR